MQVLKIAKSIHFSVSQVHYPSSQSLGTYFDEPLKEWQESFISLLHVALVSIVMYMVTY